VCLAWVFFRAQDLESAFGVLGGLVGRWGEGAGLVTPLLLAAMALGIGTQFLPGGVWRGLERFFARIPAVLQGVILGLLIVLMLALVGDQGVAPFIYFQF